MNRLFIVVAVCCALDVVLSCGNSDKSKADILQDSTEVKFSKADEILSGDDRFKSYRTWRRL